MANRKVTKDESDNMIAAAVLSNFYLNKLDRILEAHATDHDKVVVKGSDIIPLRIGDSWFLIDTDTNVSTATDLDTGTVANGKDYYVYACDDNGSLVFKISLNSTYPSGFTADNSRKIGGFHTLCADADPSDWAASTAYSLGDFRAPTTDNGYWYEVTVAGTSGASEPTWPTTPGDTVDDGTVTWTCREHDLANYYANDILPASIWDLKHRPRCSPEGMVYSEKANIWVDIYLASGTGASTASAHGGTISDSRNWMDFVDDFAEVKKQLLSDPEFQIIAAGSNEETNIQGSVDPVTTGGHVDTAGRRMISNIGCEDCCGVMWQWLRDQSYRYDGGEHNHGDPYDPTNVDPAPSCGEYNLPGTKGSLYKQGTYGDVKLRAGAVWNSGASSGSRARNATMYRWSVASTIGGRGRAEPI